MILKAGTLKCTESGYKGTISSSMTSQLTLGPEFATCTAFGFANVEVKPNGCSYVLHSSEESVEGTVDIECSEGKAIEVIAKSRGILKCTVTIGAQSGRTAVTYTNEGTGSTRDIKIDLGLTGVHPAHGRRARKM